MNSLKAVATLGSCEAEGRCSRCKFGCVVAVGCCEEAAAPQLLECGELGPRLSHKVEAVGALGGQSVYLLVQSYELCELFAEESFGRLDLGVEGLGIRDGGGPISKCLFECMLQELEVRLGWDGMTGSAYDVVDFAYLHGRRRLRRRRVVGAAEWAEVVALAVGVAGLAAKRLEDWRRWLGRRQALGCGWAVGRAPFAAALGPAWVGGPLVAVVGPGGRLCGDGIVLQRPGGWGWGCDWGGLATCGAEGLARSTLGSRAVGTPSGRPAVSS